ncbi:MAG: dienelactone hydrolase family protein [Spirochaetia bacterium]
MTRRPGVSTALFICVILFGTAGLGFTQAAGLPPAEGGAKDRLMTSPRHGEWTHVNAGAGDSVDAWVVYPERPDRAPVVIVIHEIFGLSDWVRAVADQFAAEGFIAIAPDLLSGKAPGGKGSAAVDSDSARQLISQLQNSEIVRRLNAVAAYAAALPASTGEYAVVGFCWGGGISFSYATEQPAAVVCYGTAPDAQALGRIRAPVLGLYGGSDARVDATIPAAEAEMKKLGKRYDYEIFDGAGHAFFRAQDGQAGANLRATRKGWPRMVQFLKQSFGTGVSSITNDGWASRGEALAMLPIICGHQAAEIVQ